MATAPPTDRRDSAGVPALLLVMAVATFVGAVIIAAMVRVDTWVMLAIALAAVLGGAGIVLVAISRTLRDDTGQRPRHAPPSGGARV